MRMRIKRHFFISQLFYCTGDERTVVEKFWRIFEKQLLSLPIPPLRTVSILILMLMKKSAKELFALLLYGKKRAACNSLYALAVDGNPIPQRRDYHVVTGRAGTRRCIIRIKNVIYLPFRDKTFAAVNVKMRIWIPGNPILSAFFSADKPRLEYSFSEGMPMILRILKWFINNNPYIKAEVKTNRWLRYLHKII